MRRDPWLSALALVLTVVIAWPVAALLDAHHVAPPHTIGRSLVYTLPLVALFAVLRLGLAHAARVAARTR